MRLTILFCVLLLSVTAMAQDSINPYNIQLPCNIILQGNINVYYCPVAPPAETDVRGHLSSVSQLLRDPNGVWAFGSPYEPKTRDSVLSTTRPCGVPLGEGAVWQRFFTARDKHDQSLSNRHSDIIAGGNANDTVIVSKNEDVDFRASGTVKLRHGFHVMPGAFFHAYVEPRWDTTVFSDDFDGSEIDSTKWHVKKGNDYACCSSDSNAAIVSDTDAFDGSALDIRMVLRPDTCDIVDGDYWYTDPILDTLGFKSLFSTAAVIAKPWPWTQVDSSWPWTVLGTNIPLVPAYSHTPYGKYEVRQKIPHILQHMNTVGYGAGVEYDMNETADVVKTGAYSPKVLTPFQFGPYQGVFRTINDTVFFISEALHWGDSVNAAQMIIVDQIAYFVKFPPGHFKDTVVCVPNSIYHATNFAPAHAARTDPVEFYYMPANILKSDTVTWNVKQDADSAWRIFKAPYRTLGIGDSLYFTKQFQPIWITLTVKAFPDIPETKKFACRWDSVLNSNGSDTGYLRLETPLDSNDLHSYTEQYPYGFESWTTHAAYHPTYYDTPKKDSFAYTPYVYHTFGMEWFPGEVRFLLDSNVIWRYPDRLVPRGTAFPSNIYYEYARKIPRSPVRLKPEFFIDPTSDPFGLDSSIWYIDSGDTNYISQTYAQRRYFEQHPDCSGCDTVTVGGNSYPAAHHKLDYIRIWDVPPDMKLPDFPY